MSWRQRIPPYVWWLGYLFAMLAAARTYKFRLAPMQAAGFLEQDLAIALIVAILCRLTLAAKTRFVRVGVSALIATVAFWLALAGFIVTNLLHTPVTAALLAQATDLMFVQAALGDTTVSSSLTKFGIVAALFPIIGVIAALLFDRRMAITRRTWLAVAVAFILATVCARRASDPQYRDTNALVTTVASSLGLAVEHAPEPAGIAPEQFQSRIASTGGPPHPAPAGLTSLPREKYDILLYVMETGVADIMDVDAPETASWLPEMHRLSAEGITARRHISTYANSTNSIFSIVASRYPYAGVQNVVRSAPQAKYETFVDVLRRSGYRTAALASIDNDYDRMNTFLLAHGFERSEDRDSLRLTRVHEVFGSDWDLAGHYLRWLDADPSRPSFAMLLPSNSHWPFRSKIRRFTGGTRIDAYKNALVEQDQILGHLRAKLEKRGRLERTIIVLAPDHGSYFGLADDAADDGSGLRVQHVPLVISHPALRATHTPITIDYTTSHVDLGPTLLDLVGAPSLPPDVQGVSWLRETPSRLVFWAEPTSETIGATDGHHVVRWNADENQFAVFPFVEARPSRPGPPLTLGMTARWKTQLDLFRRYQWHYLRNLTREP